MRTIQTLRDWIQGGHWSAGERLPAEQDLVALLKVSRGTVRSALKQLEAEGFLRELKGNGRKIRGRVVAGQGAAETGVMTQTIVLLTHLAGTKFEARPKETYEAAVDAAIIDAIHDAGFHLLSLNGTMLKGTALSELLRNRPKGALATHVVSQAEDGQAFLAKLAANGMPVVATGNSPGLAGLDRVVGDHASGAYELARWLIQQGHQRILAIGCTPSSVYWVQARTEGYRRALTEAGLTPLPRVEVAHVDPREHALTREHFEKRVRQFAGFLAEHVLRPDPVDAIMAQNDFDAALAAASLRLLGKVPNRDIAVVGYDNRWDSEERQWEPAKPLATVDRCNVENGREMVRLLLDRISGKLPAEPQVRVVAHRLMMLEP